MTAMMLKAYMGGALVLAIAAAGCTTDRPMPGQLAEDRPATPQPKATGIAPPAAVGPTAAAPATVDDASCAALIPRGDAGGASLRLGRYTKVDLPLGWNRLADEKAVTRAIDDLAKTDRWPCFEHLYPRARDIRAVVTQPEAVPTATVTRPTASQAPAHFASDGSKTGLFGPVPLVPGLRTIAGHHEGKGPFKVTIKSVVVGAQAIVALDRTGAGSWEWSTLIDGAADYYVDVTADGAWTVDIK